MEERRFDFQKVWEDGTRFPLILVPQERRDVEVLANLVAQQREWLDSELAKVGAIVFRGFEVENAEEFNRIVEAFGWEEMLYIENGGAATRTRVFGKVLTVNENIPLHEDIGFHNEATYLPHPPSRIFFFCEKPPVPGTGGHTPMVSGHAVYQRLLAEHKPLVDELLDKKLIFQGFPPFGKDRAGRTVWYNPIGFLKVAGRPIKFADGYAMDKEDLENIMRILDEEKVSMPWQKGDIVLLDNRSVLHGRKGCTSQRSVLISLAK